MRERRLRVTLVTGESLTAGVSAVRALLEALGNRRVTLVGRDVPAGSWPQRIVVEPRVVYRAPGCECCALRGDLIEVLRALAIGRQAPEWVVVFDPPGTDPLIAIQTFLADPILQRTVVLDGVVVPISATSISARLAGGEELRAMHGIAVPPVVPAWASTVVLEDGDRLTRAGRERVGAAITAAAPIAELVEGGTTLDGAIERGLLDPAATVAVVGGVRAGHEAVIEVATPPDSRRVRGVLQRVVDACAADLPLFMASIALAGRDGRLIAHGARSCVASGRVDFPADGGPTVNRLLVVGGDIARDEVRMAVAACAP